MKAQSNREKLAYREVERVRSYTPVVDNYTSLQSYAQNKNNEPNKKPFKSNTFHFSAQKKKKVNKPRVVMAKNWTFDDADALRFANGDSFVKVGRMINRMRRKVKA